MEAFYTYDGIYITAVLIVCLSFFFGQRWARKAMFALPFVAAIAFNVIMDGILTSQAKSQMTGQIIGGSIIGFFVYAAIISSSVPNKAFFKIPVDEKAIAKYWGAVSNKYARYAAIVGMFFPLLVAGLMIPLTSVDIIDKGSIVAKGVATVSFVISCGFVGWLCIKAFKNYAPNDIPPIQGRGYAVFGLVAAIAWVGFFVTMFIKSLS